MTFYLHTGYGVSQKGDGGSPDDPTFGLRQGNGMAPLGITAVSSLMDELYKRLGHASTFAGAWSGILFILAAIIYVDDTDLLILACSHDMSLDACFQQTQDAVMDWDLIVKVTGGYSKATKCFCGT
jgi:acetylornithine/succinyldiaminopimelate/putrescine aminotransferase